MAETAAGTGPQLCTSSSPTDSTKGKSRSPRKAWRWRDRIKDNLKWIECVTAANTAFSE